MANIDFTRKKVESLTLGERLRKIREDHRVSLLEASRMTKIQVKYLEAIEAGKYELLPAAVYVKGFLKSYAGFLGVPEDAILKLYDRECHIRENLGKIEAPRFQPKIPLSFSFNLTPKALLSGAIGIVVFGFFFYLYSEFSAFVSVPRLVVFEPMDGASVSAGEIRVKGETDARAKVTINGGEVAVNEQGAFEEALRLQSGANAIVVSATNRFGKTRQTKVMVEGDFDQSRDLSQDMLEPEQSTFGLFVRADGKDILLSVRADGSVIFSGSLKAGEERRFDGRESLSVSSNDGMVTKVRLDGQPESVLSGGHGPGEVNFTKNGRQS